MPTPRTAHVATAALDQTGGDWSGNARRIVAAVDEARRRGARLLVTPELGLSGGLIPDVAAGATTLRQEEVPLYITAGNMARFEKERGDRAWVVQRNPTPLGPLPGGGTQHYRTAVRALQLPPFSHDGTASVPIDGTLQPLTMNELPLDWKVSSFAAHAAEVHPAATLRDSSLSLSPTAYGQAMAGSGTPVSS